jgi:hypothetical protein
MLKELDHSSKWPKVADAVIEAENRLGEVFHFSMAHSIFYSDAS